MFDFDPARTLNIYEKFANDLIPETSDGKGNVGDREDNIRNLLNFFPVIGEDEDGEMVELDAAKVLSIPRKIRSQEVVRRGFMSDFLFRNISNVFHAPQTVIEIIQKFTAIQEPKGIVGIGSGTAEELSLDENGDVALSDEYVIGKSADIFGDKIFDDIPDKLSGVINDIQSGKADQTDEDLERMKYNFHKEAVSALMESAEERYGTEMRPSDKNGLERKLKADSDRIVNKAYGDYAITEKKLEREQLERLAECETDEEIKSVNQEYAARKQENVVALKQKLRDSVDDFVQSAGQDIVRTVETRRREQEKKAIEDSVKDHLRGFTRTIPSFLMAYGDNTVTLATFDQVVPGEVFLEVTSITLDQFRFLRDGGYYMNEQTGKQEVFKGHLFDDVVFNDSVREFLRLRMKLANYFEETKMKQLYPDKEQRLKHIFKEQVYGLAPTEIIYKIATNYILGFDETVAIKEHNFRQADALEYAKKGTLQQFLDELYGE